MLRFFRFNDPYRLLFVLLTVIVLGIKSEFGNDIITIPELNGVLVGEMMNDGKSLYAEVWHPMAPVTAYVQYLHDKIFQRSLMARHITVLIIIFVQAALFGIMLINNRAFNESNYLPSFIMAVISFFSFDTITLSGEIIGTLLLLLALNNLLKEIEFKRPRDETIHNLGFYLGLASLSVFSFTVFFLGVAILLFIYTRVELRRFGLYIIGFLLPHLTINLWYYWNDNLDLLWRNFYQANLDFSAHLLTPTKSLLILTLVPITYFLLSLIMMRRDARLTKYQSQIAQVMFWWMILGLIEIFLNTSRTPQSLLICVPPFVYYVSHYFLLIRRKWIAEIMIWVFMICVLGLASLTTRNVLVSVNFNNLTIKREAKYNLSNRKILVLNDDLSPYLTNKTSTFFLDWKRCQALFNDPDIYQHVVLVADAFQHDPPDVVIDPNDRMREILKYIPDIRQHYIRRGDNYERVP